MIEPEFSRVLRLEEIGDGAHRDIEASASERAALAARFNLRAVDALSASFGLAPVAGGISVTGKVIARVVQACVTSGEDVAGRIEEPVHLKFLADPFVGAEPEHEEICLEAGECDILPLERRSIDLGEIAAQTMGLALDPYPRADPEALEAARRLLLSEEEAEKEARALKARTSPFAALKRGE